MTGFSKEATYINKYGEEIGKQKYQQLLVNRESRLHRRELSSTSPTVQCEMCKKQFKRITRTHLAHSCTESITTAEYLKRFPDATLMSEELKNLFRNTKETIVEKYGEDTGNKKWKDYCDVQALTNTLEYKTEKYNLTKEEFDAYNKTRSSTLENFIGRYGEEVGLVKWDEYCERQRYTTSIDYFIEKYGQEVGEEKWEKFYLARVNSPTNRVSAAETLVYNTLIDAGLELSTQFKIHKGKTFIYDYANEEKKLLIEYNGDFWHMNPAKYSSTDMQPKTKCIAQTIWDHDLLKKKMAEDNGYTVYVIWAADWKKNSDKILNEIKQIYNEN